MPKTQNIACEVNRLTLRPIDHNRCLMPVESEVEKASLVFSLSSRHSKHDALLYHLIDVEWSVFGTLTWKGGYRRLPTWNAEKLRRADFGLLKLNTCRLLNIRPKNIAYYHAMEYGAGESHFHFLIARKGIERHDSAIRV